MDVREEPVAASLADHARIPITFRVERVLEVSLVDGGLSGIVLEERPVVEPYVKDYDALDGEGPTRWARRFDITNWGLIAAHDGGRRVGGAVIAFDTPDVYMLNGRRDLAVLWDLRVEPVARGAGVGSALFASVEQWARDRSCRQLKVETQNVNVGACRFYAGMGCTLGAISRFAYPDLPDEVQLLWFKDL